MITPVPPIFVVEGSDDVYVFPSAEAAALWLEPWWVEQGLGAAYDAEGRLLQLAIDGFNVSISQGEATPGHASQLEAILRSFLGAVGDNRGNDSSMRLESLVKIFADRVNLAKDNPQI